MVFASGTSSGSMMGTFGAGTVTPNGQFATTMGASQVTSHTSNLLAQQYAPPMVGHLAQAKADLRKTGTVALTCLFLALALYVLGSGLDSSANVSGIALAMFLLFLGAIISGLAYVYHLLFTIGHAHHREVAAQAALAHWQDSFLCFTCGDVFQARL